MNLRKSKRMTYFFTPLCVIPLLSAMTDQEEGNWWGKLVKQDKKAESDLVYKARSSWRESERCWIRISEKRRWIRQSEVAGAEVAWPETVDNHCHSQPFTSKVYSGNFFTLLQISLHCDVPMTMYKHQKFNTQEGGNS